MVIYLVVPSKTGGGWEVEPRAGGSASFAAAAAMATHELGVAGRQAGDGDPKQRWFWTSGERG